MRCQGSLITRLIVILAALHALAFVDRTMIGGVLPLLRHDVAMSDAQAGWLIGTAFALPYGMAALATGAIRRNRPASTGWLIAGGVIWTAGSVATGLAGSVATLTAARALIGIGQGIFVPMAIGRLLDTVPDDRRSRALGVFTGGATFGRSVALVAVGALLALLGPLAHSLAAAPWRWLFVLTAIPNVIAFAALATVRGTRAERARSTAAADVTVDWPALLPHCVIAVTPVLLAQAVLGWLPTLFVRTRGLTAADVAVLIGVVTLIAAPSGPVVAGWVIGRAPRLETRMPVAVLAGLVATLLLLALVVVAPSLPLATAALAAMLVALGVASFSGLFGLQLLIPAAARVRINGVYLAFATMIGVGLGPLVAGVVSAAGATDGGSMAAALIATGVLALALCGSALPIALRQARPA